MAGNDKFLESIAKLANESFTAGFRVGMREGFDGARQLLDGVAPEIILTTLQRKADALEKGELLGQLITAIDETVGEIKGGSNEPG
jgi:hypothetical protein